MVIKLVIRYSINSISNIMKRFLFILNNNGVIKIATNMSSVNSKNRSIINSLIFYNSLILETISPGFLEDITFKGR